MVRRRLMTIEPDFTVERFIATSPLERDSDRDLFAEGLRLAGVTERGADAVEISLARGSHSPGGGMNQSVIPSLGKMS